MVRHAIGLAAALWLLPAAPALAAELYKPAPGPHTVSVAETSLPAPDRGRPIALRISYPQTAGALPVIVFSHGAWGTNYNYHPLASYWASHGYAVIQPNHLDSVEEGTISGDRSAFAGAATRVEDVRTILDAITDLGVGALAGRLDESRIAMGGHSFGAYTTMGVCGITYFVPGREGGLQVGDDRVKACLVMSGQGTGGAVRPDSYETFGRPMLFMTGSRDGSIRNNEIVGHEWLLEPFAYAAPGDVYQLFLDEGDHSFGGATAEAPGYDRVTRRDYPPNPDHVAYTRSTALAFFDAYLNAGEAAAAWLTGGEIDVLSEGKARLQWK